MVSHQQRDNDRLTFCHFQAASSSTTPSLRVMAMSHVNMTFANAAVLLFYIVMSPTVFTGDDSVCRHVVLM